MQPRSLEGRNRLAIAGGNRKMTLPHAPALGNGFLAG
jgi:hypothetical protein